MKQAMSLAQLENSLAWKYNVSALTDYEIYHEHVCLNDFCEKNVKKRSL